MRLLSLSIAIAAILSGCLPRAQLREEPNSQTALPKLDMKLTVTVLDAETGKPVPDAWVLVTARITTDRPAPSGDLEAAAGARGVTGPEGAAWINEVEGTYYPGEPKGKTWQVMEQARADRLGPRKITGIEGGSIVVASPKYGFIHQPFVVEDDLAFQDWLQKHQREDYNGWLGRSTVRETLPLLSVRSKDLKKGLGLTIKMRRPGSLDEWARMISPVVFWDSTWTGMSVDAGATVDEQRRIYWLFARQLDQIGLRSGKIEHIESFAVYLRDEAIKLYLNHRPKTQDQDGTIQLWLAQKALEVLPQDSADVKEHLGSILKGVADEGSHPRGQNHFLNPNDPSMGLLKFDSAVRWAGLDEDNAQNEWDWQDAQRYYAAGDKPKAYEALGHVLRLLVNLAIPKYMQMQEARETEFESAVQALMKDQAGQLPPDYWWSTKQPTFAKMPRARFDDVAQRTVALGLEAGGGATNGHAESPALAQARKSFPAAIGQAAGLLRDFQRLMHLATFAKRPDGGDGGGGTQAGAQASSGTVTDANKFNKFTSGTETDTDTDTPAQPTKAEEISKKSLSELATDLHAASDKNAKLESVSEIGRRKPRNKQEVDVLVRLVMEDAEKGIARRAAYKALDSVGPSDQDLEPVFFEMLSDHRPMVKHLAMVKCGTLKSKKALPIIADVLRRKDSDDKDGTLLFGAIESLGVYGKAALPQLLEMSNSSDKKLKGRVAAVIKSMRDTEAVPEFLAVAKDRDKDSELRISALEALGNMPGKVAAEELSSMYKEKDNKDIRYEIVRAIGKSKNNRMVGFLRQVLAEEQDDTKRSGAVHALEEIGSPEAISALEDVLKHEKHPLVREDAAYALKKLTGKTYDWRRVDEK